MKLQLRFVTCLLSFLLISGCGWHLRGSTNISNIDSVALTVQIPPSDFINILTHEIQANQITIKLPEEASYNIVIKRLYEEQRTIGIDGSGRAAKYLLIQTIEFFVQDKSGNPLSDTITRSVEQTYDHDENRALAKENERKILQREMYMSLAHQVMRALNRAAETQAAQ